MTQSDITPSEVCEAADCKPSTLRAWHNRLHLLPREGQGWRRYSFEDLLTIRVVVILTERGFRAAEAIEIAHSIQEEIKLAVAGWGHMIAVGRMANGSILAEKIDPLSAAETALDFADEFISVLRLHYVVNRLVDRVRTIRGLPPLAQSIVMPDVEGRT